MATPTWFNEQFYLRSKLAQLNTATSTEFNTTAHVRQAIEAAGLTPYEHFQNCSLAEKTSPSQHFNTYEYLQAKANQLNDDEGVDTWNVDTVADAFLQAGFATAWDHYDQFGVNEGLNPSNDFDTSAYFDAKLTQLQTDDPEGDWTLPKVMEAFKAAELNPVSHYETFGRDEGLPVVPVADADRVAEDPLNSINITGPAWFDEQYYLETKLAQLNSEGPSEFATTEQVRDAIEGAGYTLHEHFRAFSLQEGTSPSPYFNTHEYLEAKLQQLNAESSEATARASDAGWTLDALKVAMSEAGFTSAWDHFDQFGLIEGTNPSNGFDLSSYMSSKLNALQQTDPTSGWTLERVQQAFIEAGFNPVSHYAAVGKDEGLAPQSVPEEERVDADPLKADLFTVANDGGSVSFSNGSGVISFTLNGTVATFSRGEITDATNTVDFGDGPVTLNLGTGQSLTARTSDLAGVAVSGEGHLSLTDPASVAQLTTVDFAGVTGTVSYSLVDTAANLSNAPDGLVSNATSVTANMHDGGDTYTAASSAEATQKLTVQGGAGSDTFQATLTQPVSSPTHSPTLRQVETISLQSTVAAAGLMMTNVTGAERVVNNGSTESLSVINLGNAVELAAAGVNAGQDPLNESAWNSNSNFVIRYKDAEAAPESQRISLEDSNLNLLTITALGRDENNNIVATSAGITELVIESGGSGSNAIRTFEEGPAGLSASVETVTIEGDQALTIIDLPKTATVVDGSTATGDLYLVFNGETSSAITGGSGNDTLFGGSANDVINGGAGNDVIYGRGGADTFTGGDGNDTFVIQTDEITATAADIVSDFTTAEDTLNFKVGASGPTGFSKATEAVNGFDAALTAANAALATGTEEVRVNAQEAGGAVWVFGDTNGDGAADAVVQLTGVALADFTAANVQGTLI